MRRLRSIVFLMILIVFGSQAQDSARRSQWSNTGRTTDARYSHTATLLPNGKAPFAARGITFGSPWKVISASPGPVSPVPARTLPAGGVLDQPAGGRIGGANAVLLPHFAIGGGWITELFIENRTATTVTGRVDVFDSSGAPLVVKFNGVTKSTFNYWIPGGESLPLSVRNTF